MSLQHQLPTGGDENNNSIVIDSTMVCDYERAMTMFFPFQGLPFPMERVCNGLGFATGWHHSHHHYYHYLQNKYRYKYQQIIISIIITVKPS